MPPSELKIDVFASEHNHTLPLYCTEKNSAFKYNWSQLGEQGKTVLWMNPPFSELELVLTKAVLEPCRLVIVTPLWERYPWHALLQHLKLGQYMVPIKWPLYKKDNGRGYLAAPHWRTLVSYLDTTLNPIPHDLLNPKHVQQVNRLNHNLGLNDLKAALPNRHLSSNPATVLHPHQLDPPENMLVGQVTKQSSSWQLLMDVQAKPAGGKPFPLRILIDTGAQANLVRPGALPEGILHPSPKPLSLNSVNGTNISGGKNEVNLSLEFSLALEQQNYSPWRVQASFHDAEMGVDAILSYPWLREHCLSVIPSKNCLAILVENQPVTFLHGQINPQEEKIDTGPFDPAPWRRKRNNNQTEDELLEKAFLKVQAYGMTIPGDDAEENLNEDDAAEIANIFGLVVSKEDPQDPPHIIALRDAIHRDYDNIVLRQEVYPNPPERGPLGYAHIHLKPGAQPVKARPIVLHGERNKAMCELVDGWIHDEKVEEGYGPWSQPVFAIAKRAGKWRGVVDFRGLNEATENDSHPLPRIEDILVRQGDRQMFSVLDLKDAFHQVPLHPDSRAYTCTSTPKGTYQWKVVAQGLKNGPSIFQRVIEHTLKPAADVADPYFDDVIIGTKADTEEELLQKHDQDLRRVLDLLKTDKFVVDQKKCKLFVR